MTNQIYELSGNGAFAKDFGLKDQIQRASVSVMSNIAEGFDAGTKKAFISFLNHAYRSASEVHSLLYVALDRNYVTGSEFELTSSLTQKTRRLIGGFIKYLRGSSYERGTQNSEHPTPNS